MQRSKKPKKPRETETKKSYLGLNDVEGEIHVYMLGELGVVESSSEGSEGNMSSASMPPLQ